MNKYTELKKTNKDLMEGAVTACDIVCSTMGPSGKSVAILGETQLATSKDGVNVAANVHLEDLFLNAGAQLALDGCQTTVHEVGDGTTTTAAIVRGLIKQYLAMEASGLVNINARELTSRLNELVAKTTEYLEKNAITVDEDDIEMLTKIAATSLNNDPEIGRLVAEVCAETGKNGQVIIKDNPDESSITTEVKTGYTWDNGPASLYFFPPTTPIIPVEHPLFLLSEDMINNQKHLIEILKKYREMHALVSDDGKHTQYNRTLIIIAPGVTGSALEFIVKQNKRNMPVFAVNAPNFEHIMDLSQITGAFIFSEATGNPLRNYTNSKGITSKDLRNPFGEANHIFLTKNQTSILFDKTEEIVRYASTVEDKDRRARLESGIGYFYVGANTSTAMQNTAQLIDDAQYACYSAMKHGYIPGGGYTLAKAPIADDTVAGAIFKAGIEGPVRTILSNAEVDVEGDKLEKYLTGNFNARTLEYDEDDFEVFDAVKSSISSVKNAVSVFCNIINTQNLLLWKNR